MISRARRELLLAAALLGLVLQVLPVGTPRAQVLPAQGCPKAHCDQANKGFVNLPVPPLGSHVVWTRNALVGERAGSNIGLGCSSNGTFAVCTYTGKDTTPGVLDNNAVAYDYEGARLWTSRDDIDRSAYTSAPLILGDGPSADTIVVDSFRAIRYNADGTQDWNTALNGGGYGGTPISPVLTNNGFVVLATTNGPLGGLRGKIYAIDNDQPAGPIVASLYVRNGDDDPGSFDTHKSAAVVGNRLYLSMEHHGGGDDDLAWLVALDVDDSGHMSVAWHYAFSTGSMVGGVGSSSSPMVMRVGSGGKPVVFFDGYYYDASMGQGPEDAVPQIFAVQDDGESGSVRWHQTPSGPTFAAFLADPRVAPYRSFWHQQYYSTEIRRRRVDTGAVTQSIDIDSQLGSPGDSLTYISFSAMTIAGRTSPYYMLLGAYEQFGNGPSYLLAIDLTTRTKLWAVDVQGTQPVFLPFGQYPLVSNGTNTRVVLTGVGPGVRAVGVP